MTNIGELYIDTKFQYGFIKNEHNSFYKHCIRLFYYTKTRKA